MNRLHNLDYLRGLAAFGIMVYHYLVSTLGRYNADSFMGRFGIYGVSLFFILSGLTLYLVYHEKMHFSAKGLWGFFKKRVLRIFPLLWIVILAYVLLEKKTPHLTTILLNLSGLFSLINWSGYIGTGVWSIGNELVFYIAFPFFIFLSRKSKISFWVLSLVILLIYIHFAFNVLDPKKETWEQWRNYVNPLNQIFLFLSGILIGFMFLPIKIKNKTCLLLIISGASLFLFYHVQGATINLVTGFNRIIFTLSCILVCLGVYKLDFIFPLIIHKPLMLLGQFSYGMYMLHPIIYTVFGLVVSPQIIIPNYAKIMVCMVLTLLISYFSYTYFEKKIMRIGRES